MVKIEEERFYIPKEVANLCVSKLLTSRYKVLTFCKEDKTKFPLQSIKKGRKTLIKGQWILDFISKNNL